MKLPFRHIAVLVIAAMVAVLAYQAWWLVSLYHTMSEQKDHQIEEALRTADFKEMLMRFDKMRQDPQKKYGTMEVGVSMNGNMRTTTTIVDDKPRWDGAKVSTITRKRNDSCNNLSTEYINIEDYGDSLRMSLYRELRPASMVKKEEINDASDNQDDDGFDFGNLMKQVQAGMHKGLHDIKQADEKQLDSLLTVELQALGLSGRHTLMFVGQDTVRTVAYCDEINRQDSRRVYEYDYGDGQSYHLTVESTTRLVLREMSGILATSLAMIALLGVAFWYLLRTIQGQRTLDEMKSDFTNNITHELKTPIAVAYAANDALLNYDDTATDPTRRRQYLTIVQQQLKHLSGMVEQILSLSMERRRAFALHREELVLADVLQPVVEQQRLKAGRPVSITVDIQPAALTVNADRTHLSNMLNNLIDNAIKYSPDEVVVQILADSTGITVADHGMGIAADKLPHIFDKFYRVPTGDRHDVNGYGLGLFYVKTMVEQHGWTIDVGSTVGQGTTFIIHWS